MAKLILDGGNSIFLYTQNGQLKKVSSIADSDFNNSDLDLDKLKATSNDFHKDTIEAVLGTGKTYTTDFIYMGYSKEIKITHGEVV